MKNIQMKKFDEKILYEKSLDEDILYEKLLDETFLDNFGCENFEKILNE